MDAIRIADSSQHCSLGIVTQDFLSTVCCCIWCGTAPHRSTIVASSVANVSHVVCCTLIAARCIVCVACCILCVAFRLRLCAAGAADHYCRSALTAHELVSVDSDAVTTEYRCDRRVQSSCSCLRRLRLPRLIAPTLRTTMAVLPSNRRAKLSRRRRAKAKANRRSGRAIAYMVHHP